MNPLIQRLTESVKPFHGTTIYEGCGHRERCRCSCTETHTVPGVCYECAQRTSDKSTPKPVIVDSRPQEFYRCPHCQQEIYEKHTYVEEGIERHRGCGGAIKWPPTDWSKISPEWRQLLGGPPAA